MVDCYTETVQGYENVGRLHSELHVKSSKLCYLVDGTNSREEEAVSLNSRYNVSCY